MSARTSRWKWIAERRGNRVGPIDRSDLKAFLVIGTIILIVAVAVTVIYAVDFDYAAHTTFRGELRTARGTVVAVEPTDSREPETTLNTSSKRSRRNDQPQIYAVRYSFVDANRVEHHGVSYRPNVQLKVGATVTIEHPAGRPEVSRIRGYRTAKFDTLPIGLPIMVAFGVVLLAVGLFWRVGGRRATMTD